MNLQSVGVESGSEHITQYREKLKIGSENQEDIPPQIKPDTNTKVTHSVIPIQRGFLKQKILRLNAKSMKWLDE